MSQDDLSAKISADLSLILKEGENNPIILRRIKWLAGEYLYIRKYRPFLAAGRKAFLIGLIKSALILNRRWWRWEWRWLWLQKHLSEKVNHLPLLAAGFYSVNWLVNERARKSVEREVKKELAKSQIKKPVTNIFGLRDEYRRWYDGSIPDLVSIVLPVYNQVDFLKEAIDSIVNQTYQYWELIVINDGSEENLNPVLELYRADERIKIYKRPHNGLPATLTFGFKQAKGEFYTWTSGDNVLYPNNLERHVTFLKNNPTAHCVYSNYEFIDDRSEPVQSFYGSNEYVTFFSPNKIQISWDPAPLNFSYYFIGPSFMYRGLIGKVVGDYDGPMLVEDYDFFMRVNSLSLIAHLDSQDITYRYRLHRQSLSGQYTKNGSVAKQIGFLHDFENKVRQFIYSQPYKCWSLNFNLHRPRWIGSRPKIDRSSVHLIVLGLNNWRSSRYELWLLNKWLCRYNVVVVFWLESKAKISRPIRDLSKKADWLLTDSLELLANNKSAVSNLLLCTEKNWRSPMVKALTYSTAVNKARRYGIT